jgi:hypothetical protein
MPKEVLFVVKSLPLEGGDKAIHKRFLKLDYKVTVREGGSVDASYIAGKELVVLSSTLANEGNGESLDKVAEEFRDEPVPVVVLGGGLFVGMGMVEEIEQIDTLNRARLKIVDPLHPMAAGLTGDVMISQARTQKVIGNPCETASRIATLAGNTSKVVLFGYRSGARMKGVNAPARRVGLLFNSEIAEQATPEGWNLFDAVIYWAVGVKTFDEVFKEEWKDIQLRREQFYAGPGDDGSAASRNDERAVKKEKKQDEGKSQSRKDSPPENLVGIALSGGGIRSATFSLGLLQGLHRNGLLKLFDYLSTVSGGGYVGGWWSAWLSREGLNSQKKGLSPIFDDWELKNADHLLWKMNANTERLKTLVKFLEALGKPKQLLPKLVPGKANLPASQPDRYVLSEITDELESLQSLLAKRLSFSDELNHLAEFVNHLIHQLNEVKNLLGSEAFEDDERIKTLTFNADDLDQLAGYIKKLIPQVRVCAHLFKDGLDEIKAQKKPEKRREKIVQALNRLLKDHVIYDEEAFDQIAISEETLDLVALGLQKEKLQKLNRLILEETFPDEIFRGLFPDREGIEPERMPDYMKRATTQAKVAEGSLSAGNDPIHHLRLFSNYLTPRKGAFSGDAWRAVAVLSRNILLTWLTLFPILFSFMVAGQLYFVLQKHSLADFFTPYQKQITEKEGGQALLLAICEAQGQPCELMDEKSETLKIPEGQIDPLQHQFPELQGRDWQEPIRKEELAALMRTRDRELAGLRGQFQDVLWRRAGKALYILAPLLSWILLMTVAWMRSNTTMSPLLDWIAHTLAGVVVWVLMAIVLRLFKFFTWREVWQSLINFQNLDSANPLIPGLTLSSGAILFLALLWLGVSTALWAYTWPWGVEEREWRKELRKNKIDRVQATLLVILVLTIVVLLLAGFGYEIGTYLFEPKRRQEYSDYIAKAGGWLAIVAAVAGSIYTAVKTSPTGGADSDKSVKPSATNNLIFFLTPMLVLISLAVTFSWLSRHLLFKFSGDSFVVSRTMTTAMIVGIGLCFFFVIYEAKQWESAWQPLLIYLLLLTGSIGVGLIVRWLAQKNAAETQWSQWRGYSVPFMFFAFFVASLILYRLFVYKKAWAEKLKKMGLANQIFYGFILLLLPAVAAFAMEVIASPSVHVNRISLALAGMFFCMAFVLMEVWWGDQSTNRSIYLIACTYIVLLGFLLSGFYIQDARISMGYLTLGLLTIAMSWTVALGWMSDPNLLSMHLFYKSRLVRAYLGASNPLRENEEITESAKADDVLLSELKNSERGAPYHLINTTLNLVGAKDLATAQRSSSYFVLAKSYCGSTRTGYRKTDQYMDGRLTLGTAVAISGAAVSPNMGAKTLTSSLAMLMTILNVRLGYWAPTPNRGSWKSPQARLWPFYTLREFFSQTNDLSSYCYLTDGGHFDNTGLYSLVERGCRFIVMADNGADSKTCFEDLGDAIRRCRIDFGTEIELFITPLFKNKDEASNDELSKTHFVVGTITYAKEHLRTLRWKEEDIDTVEKRQGKIILVKPALTNDENVDLRQYARQHSEFPQQSTGDLWYDEAQFESYRKIGEHCAEDIADLIEKEVKQRIVFAKLAPDQIEDIFSKYAVTEYVEAVKEGQKGRPSVTRRAARKETKAARDVERETDRESSSDEY